MESSPKIAGRGDGEGQEIPEPHPISPCDVSELDELLSGSDALQVVYFTASWCVPCQRIAPLLYRCAAKHRARVLKVDIDTFDPSYLEGHAVASVPTFLLYKANVKLARVNGSAADPLAAMIAKYA